jgi:hydrogenase maturation protease
VTPILVLGLGNPLRGDDGFAQCVLAELERENLGSHVLLRDGGTAGLEIVNLLEGWTTVIIIDALDFGAQPGQVRCMALDAAQVRKHPVSSNALHSAGLFEALVLAEALGRLPEHLTLVGVQPQNLQFVPSLSDEVRAAVPVAVRAIVSVLQARQNPAI